MIINFVFYGKPESQGSIRAFTPKGWTRPILTSTNKNLKRWRAGLSLVAQTAIFDLPGADYKFPLDAEIPVKVRLLFGFVPPKSYKKNGGYKTTRPDLDKLIRSTLDAMTGIVYTDDSQVAKVEAAKVFRDEGHVEIWIEVL